MKQQRPPQDIETGKAVVPASNNNSSSNTPSIKEEEVDQKSTNSTTMERWARNMPFLRNQRWLLTLSIVLFGGAASAAFLSLGISDEQNSSKLYFEDAAKDMANSIKSAFNDYEVFALWALESCSELPSSRPLEEQTLEETLQICNHDAFRHIYEQILSRGMGLYSLQYVSKVEDEYRAQVESTTKEWLAHYYDYHNFTTFMALSPEFELLPQTRKHVYYPILSAEPFYGNEAVIGLDVYGNTEGKEMMDMALTTWKPSLSTPVKLVQDKDPDVYSVFLVHPGVKTSMTANQSMARAVTSTVIRIPDLLLWAAQASRSGRAVYLYDSTDAIADEIPPAFLGGVEVRTCSSSSKKCNATDGERGLDLQSVPETTFANALQRSAVHYETSVQVLERQWTVVVVSLDSSDEGDLVYIILGGVLLFGAFVLLAAVFRCYLEHVVRVNEIRTQAESDKATMALERVQRERRLNEYLAHEVRNPLASAMAALSFVVANTRERVNEDETQKLILSDAEIVDSSLNYINDLLRSILDMNKAADGQIFLEEQPVDILRDVLQPATTILCMRGANVEISAEGPTDLVVSVDRLRLKQIILNLA